MEAACVLVGTVCSGKGTGLKIICSKSFASSSVCSLEYTIYERIPIINHRYSSLCGCWVRQRDQAFSPSVKLPVIRIPFWVTASTQQSPAVKLDKGRTIWSLSLNLLPIWRESSTTTCWKPTSRRATWQSWLRCRDAIKIYLQMEYIAKNLTKEERGSAKLSKFVI